MRRILRPAMPALTVAVLLGAACSRDPTPGTPAAAAEGERLMRLMSDTLAKAPAFSLRRLRASRTPTGPPDACCASHARSRSAGRTPCRSRWMVRATRPSTCRPTTTGRRSRFATTRTGLGRRRRCPVPSTKCWTTSPEGTRCRCPSPTWFTVCRTRPSSAGTRKAGSSDARRSTVSAVRTWRTATTSWTSRCGFPHRANRSPDGWSWSTSRRRARRRRASTSRAGTSPRRSPGGAFTFQAGEVPRQVSFEQFAAGLLSGGSPTSLAAPVASTPGVAAPR